MNLWLIYALVFGAGLLGVQGLYLLLFKARQERNTVNRRLVLTEQLANPAEVLEVMRKERGADVLSRLPVLQSIKELLVQSGLRLSVTKLLLSAGILAVLFFVLLRLATGSELLAIPLAVTLALAFLYLFLQRARRRRIAKFTEQLPDALDVIARGLRAGHPFRAALALAAREMPDPVGSEFGIVADEIMFGLDQSAAIDNLRPRVGQDDLSFFSTAVNVQHQTGGNLGEILTRLSRMLRNRAKLRLKIRALSSEGRLSAIFLSATPFVLFVVVSFLAPDYFVSVKDHWLIPPAALLGALMLIVGNIALYRMVNFKF